MVIRYSMELLRILGLFSHIRLSFFYVIFTGVETEMDSCDETSVKRHTLILKS